jgi:hypothetical protein
MAKATREEAYEVLNNILSSIAKLMCGITGEDGVFVHDPRNPVPQQVICYEGIESDALKEIRDALDKVEVIINRADDVPTEMPPENDGYRIVQCSVCGQRGIDTISDGVVEEGLINIKGQLYCKECADALTEMLDATVDSDIQKGGAVMYCVVVWFPGSEIFCSIVTDVDGHSILFASEESAREYVEANYNEKYVVVKLV